MTALPLKSNTNVVGEPQMLAAERTSVAANRGRAETGQWIGLALSGGGIRSATFCLGAVQRLARGGILKHFDYMSSVSGGGYTAASLQWWWTRTRKPAYDTGENFPYGINAASSAAGEDRNLAFLRWHSSFLAPGGGISIWSGLAVVLRTLLISLFVWLPVAIGVMLLIEALPALIAGAWQGGASPLHAGWTNLGKPSEIQLPILDMTVPLFAVVALVGVAAVVSLFLLATAVLVVISILIPPETTDNNRERLGRAVRCAVLGVAIGAVGAYWMYYLGDYNIPSLDPQSVTIFIIAVALLVLGAFAVIVAFLQGFSFLEFGVNYGFRRGFDLYATYVFAALLPFVTLASLPFASEVISRYFVGQAGKGTLLTVFTAANGLVSGFYGHFVQAQRFAPKYASRWAATLAAGGFLYGMILVSYLIAHFLIEPGDTFEALTGQWCQEIFFAILFFSVLFGVIGNLNYLGLHRFYRDRLYGGLPSIRSQAGRRSPEVLGCGPYADRGLLGCSQVAHRGTAVSVVQHQRHSHQRP